MKRCFLFIAVFLLTTALLFAQQDTLNRTDNKGRKQGYWKKYNGTTLIYEGRFNNDAPVGKFTYYYPNGNLKSISNFINGTVKVHTTLFHENGVKSSEGIFRDQLKDSVWNYFSDRGILIKTENYKKGVKDGIWRTYSAKTAILLEEISYRNDQFDGDYKLFYVNGDIQTVMRYVNGVRNGITESYYADSVLNMKGVYQNGFRVGKWSFYDVNGYLRKEIVYQRSVPQQIQFVVYQGSSPQRIDQELIAYFQNLGGKTKVALNNGKTFVSSDELAIIRDFIDFTDFTVITPNIIAANSAIKEFKNVSDDRIEVVLFPTTNQKIYAEGAEAKAVRALFDRSEIKEE